jgi:hypothetical protein
MSNTTAVKYLDLEAALEWSSSGAPSENTALLSRATGEVFIMSEQEDFGQEELPEDIEDATRYEVVPHKNDLDLGQDLVFEFTQTTMRQHFAVVRAYFGKRGAYAKFKSLLEREGKLDDWHAFENAAKRQALLKWAAEENFTVIEIPTERARGAVQRQTK